MAKPCLVEIMSEWFGMFEKNIRMVSRFLAVVVIFLLADGFYLSQKGFVAGPNGIELVKSAHADSSMIRSITPGSFNIETGSVLGDVNAPITIYEFSSLGCTHCSDFHLGVLPSLKRDFIDAGKVKLVFADFPIDKKSMQAAMLARCFSGDKYFDFLGKLFDKQATWGLSFKSEKLLIGYAKDEGMDEYTARKCMKDDKVASEILYIRQQAMEKLDIKATPSFLIRSAKGDELITGVPSYSKISEILNKSL